MGFFNTVRDQWHEARGKQLREEIEDATRRIAGLPADIQARAGISFVDAVLVVERERHGIANLSAKGKREIGRALLNQARQTFDFDVGRGYGMALAGGYIEAQGLPGPDAEFVHAILDGMLSMAAASMDGIDED